VEKMAKSDNSSGCGCLLVIAFVVVTWQMGFHPFFWLILLGIIVLIVLAVKTAPSNPSKTVTYSKSVFGGRKKNVKYHDTGKEVQQVTDTTWTGNKRKRTYVVQRGNRYQVCRICGSSVASSNGSYYCGCGNRWGRR
jgi:hypothetical protein